jgi:ParB family chromosome partitioning protein
MSALTRGLGKGLDALFQNDSPENLDNLQVQSLPITQIFPNPSQPRKEVTSQGLEELAQSIQNQGILQPIVVRPIPSETNAYEIVAGERRWRAAKLTDLETIPALVREITDQEALIIALVENLQREDLNPMEEARALCRLHEQLGISQDELAQKVGKSRSGVANSMRLLQLDEATQDKIGRGELSPGHARCLLALPNQETRTELLDLILEEDLTVRQTEELISRWKSQGTFQGEKASTANSQKKEASSGPSTNFTASLQDLLANSLNNKVRVSGTEKKGRISLYYNSQDELSQLLQKFGIEQP